MNVTPIVFDLETAPLPDAACYLDAVQPAKNLRDETKIKADIEQRTSERDSKCALDPNVGRIVALGWWTEEGLTSVRICENERAEYEALEDFWQESRNRTIVGFHCKGFDLKFLIQRSRYLRVPHPMLDLGKYSRKGITDLYLDLTFNEGTYDQGAMKRTLHAFCRRFGIPIQDEIKGADIPALVAAGEWAKVAEHCRSDVELTVALAKRIGVVREDAEMQQLPLSETQVF